MPRIIKLTCIFNCCSRESSPEPVIDISDFKQLEIPSSVAEKCVQTNTMETLVTNHTIPSETPMPELPTITPFEIQPKFTPPVLVHLKPTPVAPVLDGLADIEIETVPVTPNSRVHFTQEDLDEIDKRIYELLDQ